MSLVAGTLAPYLHASPCALAVAFSVLLVLWLVTAEEAELRRGRVSRD